ncbi:hypothetical protein DH2020_026275 [Rehmannia glutinosa]|uniref:Solute carrier protein n=1 Tax=Rehmannia glutinosa TaxID=99300 RepID=A0ABR0W0D4_REHGL
MALQTLLLLFLGQVVSFNLAISSFTVSLITNQGVDAPLTLSFFTYLALALVYGTITLHRRQKFLVRWYWYLLLGFVDVQGNFLVTKAYEYTSITSVTILDCWTIAWVIILTWLVLGTRYSLWQFFGAGVCLGGLALVLLSDYKPGVEGGSKPLFGDTLVIAGTVFLSMSNVGMEFCVKKKDRIEVIAMIGLFGMLVSVLELIVLKGLSGEKVTWSESKISAYAGYAVSSFLFYTIVPFVLQISGATLFNLSLLTSDMWAVAVRTFIYKQQVDWLYYLAFVLVVVGIFIYSKRKERDADSNPVLEEASPSPEYCLIDEENASPGNKFLTSPRN